MSTAHEPYSAPAATPMPSPEQTASELLGGHKAHASPAVRHFAHELGVDLALVEGRGPNGRIRFDDVKRYVRGVMSSRR